MSLKGQSQVAEDVVIGIKFRLQSIKSAFQQQKTALRKQISALKSQIQKVEKEPVKGFKGAWGVNKSTLVSSLKQQLRELQGEFKQVSESEKQVTEPMRDRLNKAKNTSDKLKTKVNRLKREFQGWALSIMFFGMAIKRAFSIIWKSSTKTFNEVMSSVEGSVTSFDRLNGSIKYLQFRAGQALEPLARFMIPIVDKVSEWIQKNQTLFSGIVAALGVGGPVLMALGMGTLSLNGFLELFEKIFDKKVSSTKLVKGLKNTSFKNLLRGAAGGALAIDAAVNFTEGDFAEGFASSLQSAAMFSIMAGKKKTGGALFVAGAAIDFATVLMDGGGSMSVAKFANWLSKTGGWAMLINPAVGGAMLTIGLVLNVLSDKAKTQVVSFLGIVFGMVATIVSVIVDGFINVFRTAAKLWYAMPWTGDKPKGLDLSWDMTVTKASIQRMKELREDFRNPDKEQAEPRRRSWLENEALTNRLPMNINIELDGEKVAKKVSVKQQSEAERAGS